MFRHDGFKLRLLAQGAIRDDTLPCVRLIPNDVRKCWHVLMFGCGGFKDQQFFDIAVLNQPKITRGVVVFQHLQIESLIGRRFKEALVVVAIGQMDIRKRNVVPDHRCSAIAGQMGASFGNVATLVHTCGNRGPAHTVGNVAQRGEVKIHNGVGFGVHLLFVFGGGERQPEIMAKTVAKLIVGFTAAQ